MKEEKEIKNISDLIKNTKDTNEPTTESPKEEKEYMQQQLETLGLTTGQKQEALGKGKEFGKMQEVKKEKEYEKELQEKEKREEMNVPAAPSMLEAKKEPEKAAPKTGPTTTQKPAAMPQVPKVKGAAAGGKVEGSAGAGIPTGQRQGMAGKNIQQSATGERKRQDTRSEQRVEEGEAPKQKKAGGVVQTAAKEAKEAVKDSALRTATKIFLSTQSPLIGIEMAAKLAKKLLGRK